MSGVEALKAAAEAARADRADDAKAALRRALSGVPDIAQHPAHEVAAWLLQVGGVPGLGATVKRLQGAVKEYRDAAEDVIVGPWEGSDPDGLQLLPSLIEAMEGCPGLPPCLPCPAEYRVSDDRVWKPTQMMDGQTLLKPIGAGIVAIIARAVDVETGDIRVTLAWKFGGRWVTETVPRAVALEGRQLMAMANRGCPVDGRSAPAVSAWLLAQEQSGARHMTTSAALARSGWTPDLTGYLWGTESIGAAVTYLPPGPGEAQRAAGYRSSGTLAEWTRHLWEPVKKHPAGLVVLAAMVPPLLPILKAPGWTLDIGGATTTGKTTALKVAASVWGEPEAVVAKWPTTWAGARNILEASTHTPTLLDDTKNAADFPETVKAVLYSAAFGRSQTMGQAGGGTRRERIISTVVISTGEVAAITMCGDAQGATTRVLPMRAPPMPPGNRAVAKKMEAAWVTQHGTAGPTLVRWLDSNRDKWPSIRAAYDTFLERIAGIAGDDLEARAAVYVAQLQAAAWVARAALGIDVPDTLVNIAADCVKDGAADRDTPRSALLWCASWWDSRPGMHGHKSDAREIIGWDLSAGRAWLEPALRSALEAGGYIPGEMFAAWRDRGWLVIKEPGRFTSKVNTGDNRVRAVLWSPEALAVLG